MKCPKCGKTAISLGSMQVTTEGVKTVQTEVFQCETCTQKVPYPEEGTDWALEFAVVDGITLILRPSASEFN
jgi:hypothetical protein